MITRIMLILLLFIGPGKSYADMDVIFMTHNKNIYFVCPKYCHLYPFEGRADYLFIDSFVSSLHRKNRTLKVLVLINMGFSYPGNGLGMA